MSKEKLEEIINRLSPSTECLADNMLYEEDRGLEGKREALRFVQTQQVIAYDAKALIAEVGRGRDLCWINARIQDMEKALSEIEKKINDSNVDDRNFYLRALIFFYISNRQSLHKWFVMVLTNS